MFSRSAFRRSLYLACAHAGLSACASSDDADGDTTHLVNTTSSTAATASAPTGANPGPMVPAAPTPSPGPAPSPNVTGPAATPVNTMPTSPTSATVPGSNTNVNPTPSEPASGSGGADNPSVPSANPTSSEPTSSAPSGNGGAPSNAGGASPEPSGGAPTSQGGDTASAGSPANNGGSEDGGSGNSGPSDAPFTRAETVRVMAFGDSTTATGDWRRRFWDKLQAAGYTNIDMVGSGSDGSGNFDGDNEGHSGVLVTNVTQGEIEGWATTNPADVVLFHWATNDVWSNVSTNNILDAYGRMVEGLRVGNANVIVLVAKIIPVAPDGCGDCPTRTVNLNDAIPAWAGMISTDASPVLVIDQWTGFDPATGTEDGVHPYTAIGAQHIADNWYDALLALYQD